MLIHKKEHKGNIKYKYKKYEHKGIFSTNKLPKNNLHVFPNTFQSSIILIILDIKK